MHSQSSNTHRIAVNPNIDLSTQNHVTCRISQGHSLYQVWTLWEYSFLSYAANISVNPNSSPTLDLWPFNPKAYHLCGIPSWTLRDHSFLSYAADKHTDRQTDKQTDSKILPMPTDIVGVGNKTISSVQCTQTNIKTVTVHDTNSYNAARLKVYFRLGTI